MASLNKRETEVMCSIFRERGEKRDNIRWVDFVKAMSKLGFGYGPAGKSSGSGRTFSAPKSLGGGSMRMDEPHGSRSKWLTAKEQAGIATRLNEHFNLETAIAGILGRERAAEPAREEAPEPPREPEEAPEPPREPEEAREPPREPGEGNERDEPREAGEE